MVDKNRIKSIRVLIVDDSPTTVKVLKGIVSEFGIKHISTTDNGKKAFSILKTSYSEDKPIDIVFSDINMPGGDGLSFLKDALNPLSMLGKPLIIMVTTVNEINLILDAVDLGAFNYVLKPYETKKIQEVLAQAVKKVLHSKTYGN